MKQSGGRIRGKVGGERMEKAQNLFNFTFKKKRVFWGGSPQRSLPVAWKLK